MYAGRNATGCVLRSIDFTEKDGYDLLNFSLDNGEDPSFRFFGLDAKSFSINSTDPNSGSIEAGGRFKVKAFSNHTSLNLTIDPNRSYNFDEPNFRPNIEGGLNGLGLNYISVDRV